MAVKRIVPIQGGRVNEGAGRCSREGVSDVSLGRQQSMPDSSVFQVAVFGVELQPVFGLEPITGARKILLPKADDIAGVLCLPHSVLSVLRAEKKHLHALTVIELDDDVSLYYRVTVANRSIILY